MAYTLLQSVNFAQPFIEYAPLTAGASNEPAISIGSMVRNTLLNPPFTWGWNRAEDSSTSTVAGTQDYTINLTDFAYLEKVALTDVTGNVFELKDVYNTNALAKGTATAGARQRPNSVSVKSVSFSTSVSIRFMGVPDAVYVITLIYQKLSLPFTATSGTWSPIPDSFIDVFNNLFLAEAMESVDDARGSVYRQRGVAALLAKAEGLTDMQRSAFIQQYQALNSQMTAAQLRTQQGSQARGI
jgi:hypothetical protein